MSKAANASHKHDMPYNTILRAGIGRVTVCRKCGLARKKIKGVFYYFDGTKNKGTSIICKVQP